jgi:hypothetical protein
MIWIGREDQPAHPLRFGGAAGAPMSVSLSQPTGERGRSLPAPIRSAGLALRAPLLPVHRHLIA